MSKPTKLKMPTPKSVAEAIEIDSKLTYLMISTDDHREIIKDGSDLYSMTVTINDTSYTLNEEILAQLRRYSIREDEPPKIILYEGEIVKAVSGLFTRIPLQDIWNETVKVLGEPINEQKTTQAIICQFKPLTTSFKRDGEVQTQLTEEGKYEPTDYQITPTIAFSFNFAERSFLIGFTIGVFFCENQLFVFCDRFRTKVIHNKYFMNGFDLTTAIKELVESVQIFEELVDESQKTPINESSALAIYWKGVKGKISHLEKVLAQHRKTPPTTLWEALMNLTWVTTHQIENTNVSVDLSTQAGHILCKVGVLYPDDYVNALGCYMKLKRLNKDRVDWKETNYLTKLNLYELKIEVIRSLNKQILKVLDDTKSEEEE